MHESIAKQVYCKVKAFVESWLWWYYRRRQYRWMWWWYQCMVRWSWSWRWWWWLVPPGAGPWHAGAVVLWHWVWLPRLSIVQPRPWPSSVVCVSRGLLAYHRFVSSVLLLHASDHYHTHTLHMIIIIILCNTLNL